MAFYRRRRPGSECGLSRVASWRGWREPSPPGAAAGCGALASLVPRSPSHAPRAAPFASRWLGDGGWWSGNHSMPNGPGRLGCAGGLRARPIFHDDDELNTNPPTPCQIGKRPPAPRPKGESAGHQGVAGGGHNKAKLPRKKDLGRGQPEGGGSQSPGSEFSCLASGGCNFR